MFGFISESPAPPSPSLQLLEPPHVLTARRVHGLARRFAASNRTASRPWLQPSVQAWLDLFESPAPLCSSSELIDRPGGPAARIVHTPVWRFGGSNPTVSWLRLQASV